MAGDGVVTGQPLTSIVIPLHNLVDQTRACLEGVFRHTDTPFELVLVDNGSTDGTGDYLAGLEPAGACAGVRLLTNRANLGVPRSWNQGLAAAAGDPICIMNNDVHVTPGWLKGLLGYLEDHPEVGILGPHVLWGEDKRPADLEAFSRGYVVENAHLEEDGFWGCCFLVTRQAAARLGPFDERFEDGFWEDVDYRQRAAEAGCPAVVTHRSVVYHHGGLTWQARGGDHTREMYWRNARRFAEKWGFTLGDFIVWRSTFVPLL